MLFKKLPHTHAQTLIIMQENAFPSDSLDDFLPSSLPALVAKASTVHQHTTFKFLGGLAEARTPLPRDVTAKLFPVQLVSTKRFQRLRLWLRLLLALLFSTTVCFCFLLFLLQPAASVWQVQAKQYKAGISEAEQPQQC